MNSSTVPLTHDPLFCFFRTFLKNYSFFLFLKDSKHSSIVRFILKDTIVNKQIMYRICIKTYRPVWTTQCKFDPARFMKQMYSLASAGVVLKAILNPLVTFKNVSPFGLSVSTIYKYIRFIYKWRASLCTSLCTVRYLKSFGSIKWQNWTTS